MQLASPTELKVVAGKEDEGRFYNKGKKKIVVFYVKYNFLYKALKC